MMLYCDWMYFGLDGAAECQTRARISYRSSRKVFLIVIGVDIYIIAPRGLP